MPAVTCKQCGKVWETRLDFMKTRGCSLTNCPQTMAQNTKPPAILTPPFKKAELAPLVHDKGCLCSRCLEANYADADDDALIEQRVSRLREEAGDKDITDWEEDNDVIWGSHYRHRRYDRPQVEEVKTNNNASLAVMKYPPPKQIKMRVVRRDAAVQSVYDPEVAALYVNVPIALSATIYPKGK